ncbi:MAG TPA: flagellar biosynthetic protein FliR [Candidatus Saccharimonadales bacterium]|jgi:flagellar biosynthetic protein FliR|nr:flagellar biosynthetic protein FliR [Candidatus Saccharimonadales bacterium]
MPDLTNWMMVFLRVSAMLSVFPVFSATNFPVQLRLALGALLAALICPVLPPVLTPAQDMWGLVGSMAVEVGIGLTLGFASRMIFFALDLAAAIISTEIGLQLPSSLNPMSGAQTNSAGSILYYLAAMLWLSLDMHHWMLVGLQRTYSYLPVGGAHLSGALMTDMISRTSETFLIALQLSAPIMAVSFIISLVFAVLGRAVPQMNVFHESFVFRILIGLSIFGLTMQLMSQHIINYLQRLPEDILHVAQLLGAG